jgi:hypothetical protein
MSANGTTMCASLAFVFACGGLAGAAEIVLSRARCKAAPLEPVHVAVVGNTEPVNSTRFEGKMLSRSHADKYGNIIIKIRDNNGMEHAVSCRVAGKPLPFEPGKTHNFQVDYVAGAPVLSGLLVRDGKELLFAAASDQRPGGRVLKDDFGFKIELLATTCPSRQQDRCYESVRNAVLRVTRGDGSVDLVNGESAVLAGYRVHCLVAQHVAYKKGCADAGLVALSYVIVRESK